MGVLKYKMPDGWKVLYQDFFQKVVGFCKQMVRKDQNLADLDDLAEARANLGLSGDNNDSHYHDNHHLVISKNLADVADKAAARENLGLNETYIKKTGDTLKGALGFSNDTWNPVGNNAYIGDKNIGGKFAIKSQTSTKQTGIAFVSADSDDNSNYGSLNYTGTKFEATKPFYATQGFFHDYVYTDRLNDYRTNNFIYGSVRAWDKNPTEGGFAIGNDYAGISFGYDPGNSDAGMAVGQLIFDGMELYFRSYDNSWADWQKIAYKSYVDSKDTATLTSAKSYTDSALKNGDFAKKDASNLTAAQKNVWSTAVATGTVNSTETKAVSGKAVNTAINSAITTMTTNLVKVSDHGEAIIVGRSTAESGYGKMWVWYRIYSDGWVEQGGHFEREISNYDEMQTVTLPVPMKNTYYALVLTKEYVTKNSSSGALRPYNKTTSSFQYHEAGQGGSGWTSYCPGNWYVCGYRNTNGTISLPTQAEYRTVTFNRSGPYDFVVTYTSPEGSSISNSNPASIFIKPNTKIKIRNDDYGYGTQVKSGSTVLASLVDREEYTSGNLSANTTFTIVGYRDESYWNDDSGCCVAEGTLIPCLQNNTIILKKIEDVCAGDTVIGANGQANEVYARTDTVLGATRTMYTFIDKSLYFTGEHSMWVKYDGQEYFGIHDVSGYYREALATVNGQPLLEWEQENAYRKDGVVGKPISKGLSREPLFVVFDAEYGTDKGWKHNKAIIAKDKVYPNNTPVHTLIVGGNHTYFANGYLVSGFATDADYDYSQVEIKDLNLF